MSRKNLYLLFILSLLVAAGASIWIRVPGYMDAEYYFAMGDRLVKGNGFSEPFLWNYLNPPDNLPHSSHQYWLPLTSIIAAFSMAVFGENFRGAQLLFILISAAIPLLTAIAAYRIHKNSRFALQAGLLAVASGFFLPFLVTTDTFAPYMLVGSLVLLLTAHAAQTAKLSLWLVVGGLTGLAHLTRADGILLLGVAALAIWSSRKSRLRSTLFLLLGYCVIMLPWWAQSLAATGSLMSPNANRVLWLLSYDELFSYPAAQLTPQRWWSAGLGTLLTARFNSLLTDLQNLIGVNGLVFLGPMMVVGGYVHRHKAIVRIAFVYLLVLLVVMSFIFPFAGARGGFFHSASAAMPILWALAPLGLHEIVKFGAKKRNWDRESAQKVFAAAAIVLAGLTTLGLFALRVIGSKPQAPKWSASHQAYVQVGDWLAEHAGPGDMVAINNPPGFYTATHLPSIVIPDGGEQELKSVAEVYEIDWVVLDQNNPGLRSLYENPNEAEWLILEAQLEPPVGPVLLIFRVDPRVGD